MATETGVHHPDDWLSRKEAALYAGVSIATIDRAIKAGSLRAKKVHGNGRVVIRRLWVDAYLLATLGRVTSLALLGLPLLICLLLLLAALELD